MLVFGILPGYNFMCIRDLLKLYGLIFCFFQRKIEDQKRN